MESGTKLGPYEITGPLGKGGMGEVYQATDTNLSRQVAIKVLPTEFAQDTERLARFEREARTLATLNHTNIAQIYGFEKSTGVHALVMELVEGPTLADRITQGPIPVDEALPIAKQIAEALEAAHEQGIIHRDLKPANVKVKSDGTVKVLDFGLAKAMDPVGDPTSVSQSPTLSMAATQAGVILGTAAYMSPEQARGKSVDKRADIWSFGVVVYEMLTGQQAFAAEDVSMTLSKVLQREPDFGLLPREIPARVRQVLKVCLQKDTKQRIGDVQDIRLALEGAFETTVPQAIEQVYKASVWWRALPWVAGVLLAATTGLAVWSVTQPQPPSVVRFALAPDDAEALHIGVRSPDVAISPDGRHIAYFTGSAGGSGAQLRVLPLDRLTSEVLVAEGELNSPFFSPDGASVGFYDRSVNPAVLKSVSVLGGPTSTICALTGDLLGASWGADGTIVFATTDTRSGLLHVTAVGGEPEQLTTPDVDQGDRDHLWPEILPGGDAVLFSVVGPSVGESQIAVLSLDTGEQKVLVRGGSYPVYSPTGHLLYGVEGDLWAVGFNLSRLETVGNPVPVQEGVLTKGRGAANFSLSGNGSLIYVPGGAQVGGTRSLVWVDRMGREDALTIEPSSYAYPRISADGTRVVLDDRNADGDLWVWDLDQHTRTRLTVGEEGGQYPVWTADGERIAYSDGADIYWKAANNTGSPDRLAESLVREGSINPNPYFFSPAGTELVFREQTNPETGDNIGMVALESDAEPVWLLDEPANERNAELSPNGRWMAYQSDESGQWEIYVRPFPMVDDDRIQVSNAGGAKPLWSRDGRELFYLEPGDLLPRLLSVAVEPDGPAFSIATRTPLLEWPYKANGIGRDYDVSPDGGQFLGIREGVTDEAAQPFIVVVQNWFTELERLVSTN